jgi:hypothetical protein
MGQISSEGFQVGVGTAFVERATLVALKEWTDVWDWLTILYFSPLLKISPRRGAAIIT